MDYGHPLRFGTLLTPRNDLPQAPVELALLSEELGLDLVTFQDHPYQLRFLDTWTLLSWVAARTERIHLAANVLSTPLRPPAVVARAAASLDLMSGGRFEPALGPGTSWEAIEAMGVQRPGSGPDGAVDALAEAIDVVRGLWASGDPLWLEGEHHRLRGAQRGPAPAHDLPVWIGGDGPGVLRLVGSKGDGWLSPPCSAAGSTAGSAAGSTVPEMLRAGNELIDKAAAEAGRDPREIRRLVTIAGRFSPSPGGFLDGPAEQWVDQLLRLAIEEGAGTFILESDDPETIRRFAEEVVPALREAVAAERAARGTPVGRVPSATVRALRREGIDYDRVPESLADTAIEPGDSRYARFKATYLRGGAPGLVLRPGNTAEVVEALAFARSHPELPLGVRSGGHGISGRSTNDGGLVIDLGRMNGIEVLDASTRRVRIGPGARWKQIAAALEPHGWALGSGDYGGVGVGGLATAGGIGFLSRKHGLTIDHLRAAELVLADGSVTRVSETEHPELFWAVRGAGANFGIVTSFEFEVDEVGEVGWAQLVLDAGDPAGFLLRFGEVAGSAPRDTTAFLVMGPPRSGRPALAQIMAMVDSGEPDVIVERLQPFAGISPMYDHQVVVTPYSGVMGLASDEDHQGQGEPISRSAFVHAITPAFAEAAAGLLRSGVVYFFQIRTVGGAVSDVAPDAMAYSHRSAGFQVTAMGIDRRRMDRLWDGLREHFDGLYLSFESDPRPERLADAFPPPVLERLRELKRRYDPGNLFRDNFNIDPASR